MNVLKNLDKLDWREFLKNPGAIIIIQNILNDNWNSSKINWHALSQNPAAIPLIEYESQQNNSRINWRRILLNPAGIPLVKKHFLTKIPLKELDWMSKGFLTINPEAVPLIEQFLTQNPDSYPDEVYWPCLFRSPAIGCILEKLMKNPEKIDWKQLSENTGDIPLKILSENPDKIDWFTLSKNPKVLFVLDKNKVDKLCWEPLSKNPGAISLIQQEFQNQNYKYKKLTINDKIGKIYWGYLIKNPAAGQIIQKILSQNPLLDKESWYYLSANPAMVPLLKRVFEKNSDKISWKGISENKKINEFCFWDTGFDSFGKLIDAYFNFYEVYRDLRIKLSKELVLNILRRHHF